MLQREPVRDDERDNARHAAQHEQKARPRLLRFGASPS